MLVLRVKPMLKADTYFCEKEKIYREGTQPIG